MKPPIPLRKSETFISIYCYIPDSIGLHMLQTSSWDQQGCANNFSGWGCHQLVCFQDFFCWVLL